MKEEMKCSQCGQNIEASGACAAPAPELYVRECLKKLQENFKGIYPPSENWNQRGAVGHILDEALAKLEFAFPTTRLQ